MNNQFDSGSSLKHSRPEESSQQSPRKRHRLNMINSTATTVPPDSSSSSVPLTPLPDGSGIHLPQTPIQDDMDSAGIVEFEDPHVSPSRRRSSPHAPSSAVPPLIGIPTHMTSNDLSRLMLSRISNDRNSLPLSPTLSPKNLSQDMMSVSYSVESLDTLVTSTQTRAHCKSSKDSLLTLSRQSSAQDVYADAEQSILQFYADLPVAQKNKLLLSLLHVSPFITLQSVTSAILPRLKKDILSILPLEISLYILSFLDLRSLGRVASVCSAWNGILEGPGADLAIWKKRCLDEGFVPFEHVPSQSIPRREREHSAIVSLSDSMSLDLEEADRQERQDLMEQQSFLSKSQHASGVISTTPGRKHSSPAAHEFKARYRHHHRIRHNWFMGKYRQISFPGHGHNVVTCLQFDDDRIVSGSDDHTIHIYDTSTGSLLKRLSGHDGGVWALQYWNGTLVSGSTDRSVRVWDMEAGECTHVFTGHTSTVRCLLIIQPPTYEERALAANMDLDGPEHPGVPLIVTGSRDATLRVWKLPNPRKDPSWFPSSHDRSPNPNSSHGRGHHVHDDNQTNPYFMHTLSGHTNSVRAIAGHATTLVSGSYDCSVRVWDLLTGECRYVFRGHREKVYSVGYCHELERAVSGSMDTSVKVWCTRTGVCLFNLDGHTLLVGLLELSPQYLVSAAADSTLRIWSPITGECLASLTGHSGAITCFHHDAKRNRIVSGSEGGVKIWELASNGYSKAGSSLTATQHTTASLTTPLNGIVPKQCPLGNQLTYKQGPRGPEPVYGRFIRDVISSVSGVWRVRMDEKRLVCAVQREDGGTWFEVLDFEAVDEDVDTLLSAAPSSAHVEDPRITPMSATPLQRQSLIPTVTESTANGAVDRRRHQRGNANDTFGPPPIMQRTSRAQHQLPSQEQQTLQPSGLVDLTVDTQLATNRGLMRMSRHSFSDATSMARILDTKTLSISTVIVGESSRSVAHVGTDTDISGTEMGSQDNEGGLSTVASSIPLSNGIQMDDDSEDDHHGSLVDGSIVPPSSTVNHMSDQRPSQL